MLVLHTREGCGACKKVEEWLESPRGKEIREALRKNATAFDSKVYPAGEISEDDMAELDMKDIWEFPSLEIVELGMIVTGIFNIQKRLEYEARATGFLSS